MLSILNFVKAKYRQTQQHQLTPHKLSGAPLQDMAYCSLGVTVCTFHGTFKDKKNNSSGHATANFIS